MPLARSHGFRSACASHSWTYICDEFVPLFEEAIERLKKVGGELVETVDYTVFEEAGKLLYEGSFVAERVGISSSAPPLSFLTVIRLPE